MSLRGGANRSKMAFEFLKSENSTKQIRVMSKEKNSRGNGYSEYSKETNEFSNLSLESLEIRVKPVIKQQSIELSSEKQSQKDIKAFIPRFKKSSCEDMVLKEENLSIGETVSKGTTSNDLRMTLIKLNTRKSNVDSKPANFYKNINLHTVREYMERYPVLKMDMITSLEKNMKEKKIFVKG